MKLKVPSLDFKKEEHREFIIQCISNLININDKDFKPYSICASTDNNFWTVGADNSWRIYFREDCSNVIDILYRYESKSIKVENILCKWLCFLLNAEIVN